MDKEDIMPEVIELLTRQFNLIADRDPDIRFYQDREGYMTPVTNGARCLYSKADEIVRDLTHSGSISSGFMRRQWSLQKSEMVAEAVKAVAIEQNAIGGPR